MESQPVRVVVVMVFSEFSISATRRSIASSLLLVVLLVRVLLRVQGVVVVLLIVALVLLVATCMRIQLYLQSVDGRQKMVSNRKRLRQGPRHPLPTDSRVCLTLRPILGLGRF